ncbi:3-oxoadipate enol-lactonase [Burkholderiaceae bacterium FT117]|uniref:bifunctional 3-oxoadipate enol-lactonase/4-carboxymuconolactone decarboxylase PcaDC n=1 Tax=Zeimonas sediminis TaxID=2944268 RepID=UPI0023431C49|nr:3-oxoadipate enol-lactonase [Zeimonas sediminis]MCM5571335.1 3-oxoadipate enol-lactonase [Zeimonas sediminis]
MPFIERDGARIHWRLDGHPDRPALVLGNSLGTDLTLWEPVMPGLLRRFKVLRIDKRGHGASEASAGDYTIAMLAGDVLAAMDAAGIERAHYCGVSIGGMIGMWLAANAPQRFERFVLSNTSAKTAPEGFAERIAKVREGGMAAIADMALGRFFTPHFVARADERFHSVRRTLLQVDPTGYAGCCAAIRDMDLRPELPRIAAPVLVVTCPDDQSTPPAMGEAIVAAVPGARHVQLPLAHIPHVEAPARFVDLVARFCGDAPLAEPGPGPQWPPAAAPMDEAARFELGLERRREALGHDYVDARLKALNPLNAGFQKMITRYAWGEIWTRPVFDDRTRRIIVLAATIAMGRWEEFDLHLRAGLQNELETMELEELLLQCAIYCGVPAANTAFHRAQAVLRNTRPVRG